MALVQLLFNVNVNNYGREYLNHGLMVGFELKVILIQIQLYAWMIFSDLFSRYVHSTSNSLSLRFCIVSGN